MATSPNILARVPDTQSLNYYAGDAHVHTRLGGDAPGVDIVDQAKDASSAGLQWLYFTEHSDIVAGLYPFFIPKDYLTEAEWQKLIDETNLSYVFQTPQGTVEVKTLPGEEVTVGNGIDLRTLGHFLTYGVTNRVEPFKSWNILGLPTSRRTVDEIISDIEKANGFGYVAHPFPDRWSPDFPSWRDWGAFEKSLNSWQDEDSQGKIDPQGAVGLEIMRGGRVKEDTLNRWDKYLKQQKKIFGIGNSDSHGLEIGSSFTYLYTGGTLTKSGIKEALRKGHAIFSNGPFVTFSTNKGGVPGDEVKASVGETLTLNIQWVINPEHGFPWELSFLMKHVWLRQYNQGNLLGRGDEKILFQRLFYWVFGNLGAWFNPLFC